MYNNPFIPNHTLCLAIPTLNRFDLLQPALEKYLIDFGSTPILIIDNGRQGIKEAFDHPNLTVIEPEANLGVAGSWNFICKEAFKTYTHVLMLNDDIYLGKPEHIFKNLITHYGSSFMMAGTNGWCCFILSQKTYEKVGDFDEKFKIAFFEDSDFQRRMELAGIQIIKSPLLEPLIYRNSQTIEKDPTLNSNFGDNSAYYESKWGGGRGAERFTIPFNKQEEKK